MPRRKGGVPDDAPNLSYENLDVYIDHAPKAEAGKVRDCKDRFGKHTYALEEFGLRREAVAERFADYTARFDIRAEP